MAHIFTQKYAKNETISATTSYEIPEVRNYDEMIVSLKAGGITGTPTLDVDVESMLQRIGGATEAAYWARLKTQSMGTIGAAGGAEVHTPGDFSYGLFTQVTSAAAFPWVEIRGLPALLSHKMRVTLRLGGSGTFTFVVLYVILKAKGVESGALL